MIIISLVVSEAYNINCSLLTDMLHRLNCEKKRAKRIEENSTNYSCCLIIDINR